MQTKPSGQGLPQRGLVVREPWITMLLDGTKTWELRGSATRLRGQAGLIGSGTGAVAGEATLVDCLGPLTRDELAANVHLHRVERDWNSCDLPYANVHAWVFENARRYPEAVSYRHPQGAVIWVGLDAAVARIAA